MRIGKLDKRITFQRETRTSDGAGGYTRTWSNVVTVWGNKRPLRGTERLLGQQQTHAVTHNLTIRYREDVTTAMRAVIGSTVYNIRTFVDEEDSRERFLVMAVEQGVAV